MAYSQPPETGDMRATLALSQSEAQTGSTRTLNLPGGRRILVSIPPGVFNGQELRVAGQGEPPWPGGPAGDLVLTISVVAEPEPTHYDRGFNDFAPTEAYQAQSMPQTAPPPPAGGLSPYTTYPPQPEYNAPSTVGATRPAFNTTQEPLYLPQNQAGSAGYQPPTYSGSPGYTTPGQIGGPSYPPPAPRKRRLSPVVLTLIVVLILLLLAGSGLIYYVGVYQPRMQHEQATATAQAQLTGTANAQASASAQANATANALASATVSAQSTAAAQASATAAALQTMYNQATGGTPALNDPLSAQTGSNWDVFTSASSSVGGSCQFLNSAYHSNMPTKPYYQPCYANAPTFTNFAFQVQMTITQGDEGGILFRADPNTSRCYLFRIDTNGNYLLFVYASNQASSAKQLLSGVAQGFKTGLNQSNTLTVIAQGANLYFYVNGQYTDSASDSTLASGKVGVFGEDATNPTDVAFNNAEVWMLS